LLTKEDSQSFPPKKKFGTVLVTGGAGFVGSHIVENVLELSDKVKVLDNFSSGRKENLPSVDSSNLSIIRGDIRHLSLVKEALRDVDVVFHEAALTGIQQSIKDPQTTQEINVEGTRNLLTSAMDSGVNKFVFASTSAVYGDSKVLPRSETATPAPISPYGWSKLEGEEECLKMHRRSGLETTILRYFNIYGPRSTSKEYSGVINAFAEKILDNRAPTIYGDGKNSRDFVHVYDIVQANLLAASSSISGGKIYNVGTGTECSVERLAKLEMEFLLGDPNKLPLEYLSQRKGDVPRSFADISLIRKDLGFKPKYNIENGLNDHLKSILPYLKQKSSPRNLSKVR
jgi:UDP-glucose 4-epimerase